MRSRFTNILLGVLGLATIASVPANAGVLRTEITALSPRAIAAGNAAPIRFTLTNTSTDDVFVLDYQTPLKGLQEGLFRVLRNGEPVEYEGIHAIRVGPLAENWVRIPAGESVSAIVDLSQDYPLHRAGTYVVYFDAALQVYSGGDVRTLPVARMDKSGRLDEEGTRFDLENVVGTLASEAVYAAPTRLVIRGNAAARLHGEGELPGTKAFTGCTSSISNDLLNRQAAGRSNALRGYNAATSFSTWYRTWFGNSSGSVSTVRSRFANSYNRMGTTINYFCGSSAPYCSAGVVLYTYKTTTNTIYVCSAYASQSSSFRAHAVNHESYHWNTVAGADDVTYGSSQCQSLAASNPSSALRNADNYAYAADTAP